MTAMLPPQKSTLILVYVCWCPIVPGKVAKLRGSNDRGGQYFTWNPFEYSFENLFIDGTKIEANANKYNFVWKKVEGIVFVHGPGKRKTLL
jgi:hypothetical protein